MSGYVADTMALVRFLEDSLPAKAERVFRGAEAGLNHIFLPEIALAEFVYLSLKGRFHGSSSELTIRETIHNILSSAFTTVVPMSPIGWDLFPSLPIREMHDRMIASEALTRNVPLISNDPAFSAIDSLHVVW